MVYSEQQLQDYVLEGSDLPERHDIERKVQEIMDGLDRGHLKNIMRVAALLYANDKTGKFDEIESHKRLMRLLSVAREEDRFLGDYIHFFNSCLDNNSDLWQVCLGQSDINLGRAFLKGGISLPDFNSWKTLIRDGYFDTILIMPPVVNIPQTIIDRFQGYSVKFRMPARYKYEPREAISYTFAVDTAESTSQTNYYLQGQPAEQSIQVKGLSEEMARDDVNINLSGLTLNEYMLLVLDSYRIHGESRLGKMIDVDGPGSYLLAEPFATDQTLYLEAGSDMPGHYLFEYSSREGPVGRVKAMIKPEGLIDGL